MLMHMRDADRDPRIKPKPIPLSNTGAPEN